MSPSNRLFHCTASSTQFKTNATGLFKHLNPCDLEVEKFNNCFLVYQDDLMCKFIVLCEQSSTINMSTWNNFVYSYLIIIGFWLKTDNLIIHRMSRFDLYLNKALKLKLAIPTSDNLDFSTHWIWFTNPEMF